MNEVKQTTEREWIPAAQAGRIIGVNPRVVADLAGRGLIGTRVIPSKAARYNRADCLRLADEATRPATTTILAASK